MLRLDTLSTAQLVGLALLGTLVYLAYAYRDRRAIGTRPRPDLVSFDGEQTFLLGDFPMVLKHKHRMLDRLYERQLRDGHLLKEDPSRAFTMTLPGMRMVLITKPEVCPQALAFPCNEASCACAESRPFAAHRARSERRLCELRQGPAVPSQHASSSRRRHLCRRRAPLAVRAGHFANAA